MTLTCSEEFMEKKKGGHLIIAAGKPFGSFCVTAMWAVVYTVCLRCTVAISANHGIFICIPLFHLQSPPVFFICLHDETAFKVFWVSPQQMSDDTVRLGKTITWKRSLFVLRNKAQTSQKWVRKQGNSNLLSCSSTKMVITDQTSPSGLYSLLLH